MELHGKSYVIDHCYSERDKELERKALDYYITDTLHLIGMNIAGITRGKHLVSSWRDLCNGTAEKQEQKTGDEIAAEVIKKAGLRHGGDK